MESNFEISEPLVLHTLSGYGRYTDYDSAEIFIDADNHIIILSSFGFRDSNGHKQNASLSVLDTKMWVNSELVLPGYPSWHGMVDNGIFQAYAIYIPQAKEHSSVETISIYNLTSDMKLTPKPTKTVKMDTSKKAFKHEDYRMITKLLPLQGRPDKFFIVGYYVENRWNLTDLIKCIRSFGHWGFVERPFAAIIDNNNVSAYYTTSENLKTNECSKIRSWVVHKGKIHFVGVKHREYCDAPPAIQYLHFDISKNQWAEPLELFKGYRHSEKITNFFSNPSLDCNGENIYFTWPWIVIDYDRRTRTKESGIYFCSKTNNLWNKTVKLSDSGEQPQVIVDNNGKVYVFWIERNKGLFYKLKTNTGWSDVCLAIKDFTIRVKETGLLGSPSPPFSIAVDQNNNFHIIYIRESSGLVYIKLTHAQKITGNTNK